MHFARIGMPLPPVGETVARANRRRSAGVAAAAACLLLGLSAAEAIADPGGGHSWHSSNGNGDSKGNGNASRGGSDSRQATVKASDTVSAGSRPPSKFGSGAGTSAQHDAANHSPRPPQFKPPKVTFGDGRTPGAQGNDVWHGWPGGPVPPPAPLPPPQVVTVALNPPTVTSMSQRRGLVGQLVAEPTGVSADPLWPVAGLLLIPAAGAILGYRQARAAQAAARLAGHS
jgi:hypothetical protein